MIQSLINPYQLMTHIRYVSIKLTHNFEKHFQHVSPHTNVCVVVSP